MIMKKLTLSICLILFSTLAFAQAPSWLWVKSSDIANNYADGNDVTVDSLGNAFVIGDFQSPTLTLDSIILNVSGVFIAKYNPEGKVIWAKSFGGSYGAKIKLDGDGNLIIAGNFDSFSVTIDTIQLINHGSSDVFLAKLDTAGNVIWAKSIYGNAYESCYDIAVDNNNDILMLGYGDSLIHFDSLTMGNVGYWSFLVKYNTSGNPIWVKEQIAIGLNTDRNNNIFLIGNFSGQGVPFGNDTLNSINSYLDIFIAKLNPLGNILWAKSFGGIYNDEGICIKIDSLGNIYIAGQFGSPYITFSADTIYNNGMIPYRDVFCAKLDSSCNAIWATSFGGVDHDFVHDIDLDHAINVCLTGSIGGMPPCDAFLLKYDSIGNIDWYKITGGYPGGAIGYGLACNNIGGIYVTGYAGATAIFDSFVITGISSSNFFLSKTDTICGIPISVNNPAICKGDTINLIATGASSYTWSNSDTGSTISVYPSSTTTYTVTGTDGICRGYAFATVSVNPTPIIHQNGDTLVSNIANGNQWYIEPGGLVAGATNQTYVPVVNGYYYVIVTDTNGCISDSSNHIYYNNVSADDLRNNSVIIISPNPTHDKFTITNTSTQKQTFISIFNIQGQQMKQAQFKNQTTNELDVSDLAKGIYVARVQCENGVVNKKLVIE